MLYCLGFCQLETNRVIWEEGTTSRKNISVRLVCVSFSKEMIDVGDSYLCGPCHPLTGGLTLYIGQVEQAMENNPLSSIFQWALFQSLLLGPFLIFCLSFPQWWTVTGSASEIIPFLPKFLLVMICITAIESKLEKINNIGISYYCSVNRLHLGLCQSLHLFPQWFILSQWITNRFLKKVGHSPKRWFLIFLYWYSQWKSNII